MFHTKQMIATAHSSTQGGVITCIIFLIALECISLELDIKMYQDRLNLLSFLLDNKHNQYTATQLNKNL